MKLASFLCLIFCAIIFSFEDTSQIEYIDYYDIPCHSLAKSSVDGNSEAGYYLTHDYKNGILEIDLNFLSYCNSVYRDSVIIDGNNIQIVLIDTANATAKCICNHECLFDFNLPNYDEVFLEIYTKRNFGNELFLIVDTTMQIINHFKPIR